VWNILVHQNAAFAGRMNPPRIRDRSATHQRQFFVLMDEAAHYERAMQVRTLYAASQLDALVEECRFRAAQAHGLAWKYSKKHQLANPT
jgi:hypothetical protein